MAEYEFFVIFLRLWFVGFVGLILNALSLLLFRGQHDSVGTFLHRIGFAVVWPLTVFSSFGRSVLFDKLEDL